ncbi:MAG: IS1595 family transposase [Aestuariivita sp.]|nr:IS1595 family transposase [Aestuariivita sp.]MCY4346372.1 IS1595 family transposase [Aestuariivita sp.]
MNLLTVFTRYPDQEACIEHLEKVRWGGEASCPHCGCTNVARKQEKGRMGRWNCHGCKSSFNVLSGSIFEKTRLPLQKWFLAIGMMVNAKKSLSSCQLARDLDMNQRSAWHMQQRIRVAMLTTEGDLLQGIVKADETYVGGKPRKGNKRRDDQPNKRGQGTKKIPVIGALERGVAVVAKVADDLSGKGILAFLKDHVDTGGSLLITYEYRAYNAAKKVYQSATINHKVSYADSDTYTNSIEGFWSLIKRAWYGSHHYYTAKWMPFYVAESTWKHNQRKNTDAFGTFVRGCFA